MVAQTSSLSKAAGFEIVEGALATKGVPADDPLAMAAEWAQLVAGPHSITRDRQIADRVIARARLWWARAQREERHSRGQCTRGAKRNAT